MKQTNFNFVVKAIITAISTVGLVGIASAADLKENLKGCYKVERAVVQESSIDAENVIGLYAIALSQGTSPKKSVYLVGPLKGSEVNEGHVFGTKKRVGTFSTEGDSITVNSAGCFDALGKPHLVKGTETFKFVKGTGIFSGLTSGMIEFDLTFDSCTDPGNPIANLEADSGELCFK